MAVNTGAGEVAVLIVIKNRSIVRVEEAGGTEGAVSEISAAEKQAYSRSQYGCRPVETIYEHDTLGPNTCFMIIGGFKVKVPCS